LANAKTYICVGTDPFHTPPPVRDAIIAAAVGEGCSVAVDVPFAGALVPLSSYQRDRRIPSVMIEVNRHLHMDERTGQKRDDFETVRAAVGQLIVAAAEAAAHRRGRSFYRKWKAHGAAQIAEIAAALDHRCRKPNEKRLAVRAQINWAKERRMRTVRRNMGQLHCHTKPPSASRCATVQPDDTAMHQTLRSDVY
jgi:hypothetical protein